MFKRHWHCAIFFTFSKPANVMIYLGKRLRENQMLIFSFCNIVKKIRKLALMGFEKVKKVAERQLR